MDGQRVCRGLVSKADKRGAHRSKLRERALLPVKESGSDYIVNRPRPSQGVPYCFSISRAMISR